MVAGLDYKNMLDGGHTYDGHFSYPTMFTGTYKNTGGQNCTATGASIDQVVSTAVAKTVNLPVPLLTITVAGQVDELPRRRLAEHGREPGRAPLQDAVLGRRRSGDADPAMSRAHGAAQERHRLPAARAAAASRRAGAPTTARRSRRTSTRSARSRRASRRRPWAARGCMPVDPGAPTMYQDQVKAFNDLVAMAFRCDVTRTVAMSWADDGGSGPYTMPFLNLDDPTAMSIGEVHDIAHEGATGYPKKIIIDTWYMQQLAYLAGLLDASAEGGGTILDNSLIVMGNDMSEGSFHSVSNIPVRARGRRGRRAHGGPHGQGRHVGHGDRQLLVERQHRRAAQPAPRVDLEPHGRPRDRASAPATRARSPS